MKNASLILNVVLLVAVAILYFLHFSQKSAATKPTAIAVSDSLKNIEEKVFSQIAYVNSDSLLMNYKYYKDTKENLEEKRKKLEQEIAGRTRSLQNEVVAYQQKGRNLTLEQAQLTEQNLMRKEQELVRYRDESIQKLAEEEQKEVDQLYTNITKYLKGYTKDKPYKFVFGYSKGGGILFANDSLEITKDVLQGLNNDYQPEKKP